MTPPTQSLSERLRDQPPGPWIGLMREAADALDAKDEEINKLRTLLRRTVPSVELAREAFAASRKKTCNE